MDVSFVIPCYKSAATLRAVVSEIKEAMLNIGKSWELVLVNDCSPDDTFAVITDICNANKNCVGVNLARNFGQHAALMAGFAYVSGDIIVCLDDDGQTPANEVGSLLKAIDENTDVVYASYQNKKHSLFRNFGSAVNEAMAAWLLGKPKSLYVSSYFAAKKYVIEEIKKYNNPYPYVIGLVLRTTNKVKNVAVKHRQREIGKSGYTIMSLLKLWLNGFTSFSVKPLRVATITGAVLAFCAFCYSVYVIINKLLHPQVPAGWSSLLCALMFIGGMLMLMLGLIGEYIGRIYISLNNAPQYVIREIVTGQDDSK